MYKKENISEARLKRMLAPDEKITPKKWTEQKARLEAKLQESNPGYAKVVTELASAEVIEHNRKMYALTREAGGSYILQ